MRQPSLTTGRLVVMRILATATAAAAFFLPSVHAAACSPYVDPCACGLCPRIVDCAREQYTRAECFCGSVAGRDPGAYAAVPPAPGATAASKARDAYGSGKAAAALATSVTAARAASYVSDSSSTSSSTSGSGNGRGTAAAAPDPGRFFLCGVRPGGVRVGVEMRCPYPLVFNATQRACV